MSENDAGKKKSKKKKRIFIVIAVVIIVVIAIAAIVSTKGAKLAYPVETAAVKQEDISSEISVSGLVMSEESKVYFAPVTAKISALTVKEGEPVKKGDLLLAYDLEDLQLASKEGLLRAEAESYGIDASVKTINKEMNDYAKAVKDYDEAMLYVNHWSHCLESATRDYYEANTVATEYNNLKAEVDAYKIQQAENETPNEALAQMIAEGDVKLAELAQKMEQYDYAALQSTVEKCSKEMNEYKALAEQYKAQKIENPALSSQKAQQSVLKELNSLEKENADRALTKAAEGICADFDGIASEVTAVEGQTVSEGMQLFTLQRMDKLKVVVGVTKYDLQQIAVGQKAEITINGRVYNGTVEKMSRIAGRNENGAATINVDIHIDNPDDNIYIGIEGKTKILCDTVKDAYVLPFSCVNYDTKGAFCYVVEDGVIVRRDVEVGISSDTMIQIISGVSLNDKVVSEVTTEITEGTKVTVADEETEEVINP